MKYICRELDYMMCSVAILYNVIGGIDYGSVQSTTYMVSFPAGVTCGSFNVSINDDTQLENDERFEIRIIDYLLPYGVETTDNISSTTVVIEDNECKWPYVVVTHAITLLSIRYMYMHAHT